MNALRLLRAHAAAAAAALLLVSSSAEGQNPPPAPPGTLDQRPAPSLMDRPSPMDLGGASAPAAGAARDDIERELGRRGPVGQRGANSATTIDFYDEPLIRVFRLLADAAGINFIAPPIPPDQKITVHLEKVTPLEAFRDIARLRGFEVVDDGRIVSLRRPDLQQPTFTILKTYRVHNVAVDLVFQRAANALGIKIASGADQSPAFPKAKEPAAGTSSGGIDAQLRPRFVAGLPMDEGMFRAEGRETSIGMDRRQNAIVLRATSEEHDLMARTLASVDVYVPQIEITTYIVEVDAQNSDTIGVDWSNTLGNDGWKLGLSNFNDGQVLKAAKALFYQGAILTTSDVSVVVRALRGYSKTVNFQSPHVITQAGMPVTINGFDRETIAITQPTTTGNTTVASSELKTFVTGLTLSVTPRVLGNGRISLNLNPQLSSKVGVTQTSVGSIPITNDRGLVTDVMINDGDAVVLGGIVQSNSVLSDNKVPFFGDIPVVGYLFKTRGKTSRRTNVLFIVQARMLPAGSQPGRRLGEAERRAFDSVADLPGEPPRLPPAAQPPPRPSKQVITRSTTRTRVVREAPSGVPPLP